MRQPTNRFIYGVSICLAYLMFGLLMLPLLGLLTATTPAQWLTSVKQPIFLPALWLSLQTTCWSMCIILIGGTPLAWMLAKSATRRAQLATFFVDVPLVLPPAVVGIGLLYTFGPSGWLGSWLNDWGLRVPFTTTAVVLAQVMVSAPFYIQSATASFRRLHPDLLLVGRTLGHTPTGVFFRIALPLSLPGLLAGAALSWGRALGEFGATLLFAGNLPGTTQTMPLAIYMALESDVHVAIALSLFLAACGIFTLFALRVFPTYFWRNTEEVQQ